MIPTIPTTTFTSAAQRSRSVMMAVVLGASLAATSTRAEAAAVARCSSAQVGANPSPELVEAIARYCNTCWRNARLAPDRWADCTQAVFARLLERVPLSDWSELLSGDYERECRKEFFRAIDAVKKQTQRARRAVELPASLADLRDRNQAERNDQREAVRQAADAVLSDRQRRIVELTCGGWGVPEIAEELNTTPERISDEKYKAIRKLREHLGVDAAA
jgi:RNA polymerase sigma factor (sigma-70 family)